MAKVIKMPKLSDTMTNGTVAKWYKKLGDNILEGELLAEIETDKATMEFESFESGTLLYIGVEEKKSAAVDDILAIIGEKKEDISSLISSSKNFSASQKSETSEVKKQVINTDNVPAEVIVMPKLSDTMTEGTLVKWHKKVGDSVSEGELLAEIETDKATMEFESFNSGTLLYKGIDEGKSAKVDAILAIIGEKGADYKTLIKDFSSKITIQKEKPTLSTPTPPPSVALNIDSKTTNNIQNSNSRIFASPLAKKIADDKNINLNQIKGSGPNGRIIKNDLENYTPSALLTQGVSKESYEDIPHSQMRRTIAARLSKSKFSAPHYYLSVSINMDNIIEVRKSIVEYKNQKISFNDFVIKAVAHSIRENPKVNVSFFDNAIRKYNHIHIGVATAVDDGLVVPVLRFVETKSLTEISKEVKNYVQKAKEKKLQPSDYQGNTFTISNLGMYGIETFTSIINSPESCIMSVGAITPTPIVKNDKVQISNLMKINLACDHRAVDGAVGALFLKTFKQLLENPVLLLGQSQI